MKIIIISDIRGTSKSIIPFGLKLARHLESEADVVHVIDSRSEKVLPSSYSDSQTFALGGEKFSYKDTLQREISRTKQGLNDLLSKEASRLNYPLKVISIIEENSIEAKIREYMNREPFPLFLMNAQPDGHIFSSQKEMINITNNAGAVCLLIPPGRLFKEFEKIILPTDFRLNDIDSYKNASIFFKPFNYTLEAINISKTRTFLISDTRVTEWERIMSGFFSHKDINTSIVRGTNHVNTLINYLNNNNPDLVMLFRKKQSLIRNLLTGSLALRIIRRTSIPVLLYSKAN